MIPLALLDLCEHVYDLPQVTAGPAGRDGASIVHVGDETALVFRGTVVAEPGDAREVWERAFFDWLNDLRRDPVSRPEFPGRVHKGFHDSVTALWPKLSRFDWTRGRLSIAGHSKGGALAVLAGWLLREHRPRVVTFAAPKVGDDGFAAAYFAAGPATVQYRNPHDIVPKLPLVGYDQVGAAIGPPATWQAPFGLAANHHLATYREWLTPLDEPTPSAKAA